MSENAGDWTKLGPALSAPFDAKDVKWKPQAVKGAQALAVAYIKSEAVMDRLDEAAGPENWQDTYTVFPDGSVGCRLSVRAAGGEWVTKEDVGSPSEQPDGGDRMKAAFSDALKRVAGKFGIGRYIRKLPLTWCPYDAIKKQFTQTPNLPAFAQPRPAAKPAHHQQPQAAPATNGMPKTGIELLARVREYDAKLAKGGVSTAGALLAHVAQAGEAAGYGLELSKWTGPAIPFAVAAVKKFEAGLEPAPASVPSDGPPDSDEIEY